LDRWFHSRVPLHVPADVDRQVGVRRVCECSAGDVVYPRLIASSNRVPRLCTGSASRRSEVFCGFIFCSSVLTRLRLFGKDEYHACDKSRWTRSSSESPAKLEHLCLPHLCLIFALSLGSVMTQALVICPAIRIQAHTCSNASGRDAKAIRSSRSHDRPFVPPPVEVPTRSPFSNHIDFSSQT